jgi:hypothetical protein
MSQPDSIDPRKLRPGPICHDALSPELLEHIKAIFEVIGPFLGSTLEQFEIGFMRDMHPEAEVGVWAGIATAWLAYHEKFLNDQTVAEEEEKKLITALIAISTGLEDLSKLNVPVEVGRKLLQCYESLGKD